MGGTARIRLRLPLSASPPLQQLTVMELLLKDGPRSQIREIPYPHDSGLLISQIQAILTYLYAGPEPSAPWIHVKIQPLIRLPLSLQLGKRLARVSNIEDLDRRRSARGNEHRLRIQRMEGDLPRIVSKIYPRVLAADLGDATSNNAIDMLHRRRARIFGVQADCAREGASCEDA